MPYNLLCIPYILMLMFLGATHHIIDGAMPKQKKHASGSVLKSKVTQASCLMGIDESDLKNEKDKKFAHQYTIEPNFTQNEFEKSIDPLLKTMFPKVLADIIASYLPISKTGLCIPFVNLKERGHQRSYEDDPCKIVYLIDIINHMLQINKVEFIQHADKSTQAPYVAHLDHEMILRDIGSHYGLSNTRGYVIQDDSYREAEPCTEAPLIGWNTIWRLECMGEAVFTQKQGSSMVTAGQRNSLFYLVPGFSYRDFIAAWVNTMAYLKRQCPEHMHSKLRKKFETSVRVIEQYPKLEPVFKTILDDSTNDLVPCFGTQKDYKDLLARQEPVSDDNNDDARAEWDEDVVW